MSAQEILDELPKLTAEELKAVAELCSQLEEQRGETTPKKRIFDMHPGAMLMSPDFNDPLPDEFWLGKDA